MSKKVFSHLIGAGLFLAGLALLVGGRAGEVEQAAAPNVVLSEAATGAGIDPADRKFLSAGDTAVIGEIESALTMHAADRKFYSGGNAANLIVSKSPAPLANVEAADRKFFSSGDVAGSTAASSKLAAAVDPADRKFLNSE